MLDCKFLQHARKKVQWLTNSSNLLSCDFDFKQLCFLVRQEQFGGKKFSNITKMKNVACVIVSKVLYRKVKFSFNELFLRHQKLENKTKNLS